MNSKEFLIISIITLATVLSWIIYDVFHTSAKSTVTTVQQELMKPLTPQLPHETIVNVVENQP